LCGDAGRGQACNKADADDQLDANGKAVLDFWQAQEKARAIHKQMSDDRGKVAGFYTVKDALDD